MPSATGWLILPTTRARIYGDPLKANGATPDSRKSHDTSPSLTLRQADSTIINELSDSSDPDRRAAPKFTVFAWFVLVYNLAAVAWGVFVRASKSGDGGGAQWPLLDLNHEPMNGDIARLIEGSHRISTSLCGVFAIVLVVMAIRNFPKGHQARLFSWVALALTLLEGAIGAVLVLFGLVTTNDSAARVGVMSFHVISTMLLVSSIALAAMSSMGAGRISSKGNWSVLPMGIVAVLSVFVLAVSGAVSALGHTLMPVDNVLAAAANPASHWLLKLQPLHPYLSLAVGLFFCIFAGLGMHLRPSRLARKAGWVMLITFGGQLMMGLASIKLNAPIWMQMVHLVLGDVVFVSMLVFLAGVMLEGSPSRDFTGVGERFKSLGDAIRGYVALTKPRVISLLLFTAGMAMFAAAKGWPGFIPFLSVMIGGYLSAGAANAMNMVIDTDIDGLMHRTSKRPTVSGAISTAAGVNFSLILTVLSFAILWAGSNLWAAMIALAGQAFYVCVYTLFLKRRTWHNIVIGGAAGSVPPMVGWVAVTGSIDPMAWWMFALIFIWTPVHFWALAMLLKDDYADARVPMLPVEKGERATASQISFYVALTVALSLLPVFVGASGALFLAGAILVDLVLIRLSFKLSRSLARPQASALFHYSMLYLALLFLAVAIDQRWSFAIF
jgi:protoheme IX farnesyltransferase